MYESMLAPESAKGLVGLPPKCGTRESVFHLFVIQVRERERIIECLRSRGIGFGVHYPFSLAEQAAYMAFARSMHFPVATELARTVLSLPLYPTLSETSIGEVVCAVKAAL